MDLIKEYCQITGRHISTISVEEFLCFKGYEKKYPNEINGSNIENNHSHISYVEAGGQNKPDYNYCDQPNISDDKEEIVKVASTDTQERQSKANMMAMLRSVKG